MNFFEFLTNRNYKKKMESGILTSGRFTGRTQQAFRKTKSGFCAQDYLEYELVYDVDGETCHGWYSFYPLPDPSAEEIAGTTVKLRYNKRKPHFFEVISDFFPV